MTIRYGAIDAHYPAEGGARVALVVATEPRFATLVEEKLAAVTDVPAYRIPDAMRRVDRLARSLPG